MAEQNKWTKKRVIWLGVILGLGILANLALIFEIEDWSSYQHLFGAIGHIVTCLFLVYVFIFILKKYKQNEQP